jgi:CheY-like chemotaxis protein
VLLRRARVTAQVTREILVVEDDADTRAAYVEALAGDAQCVTAVSSAEDALVLLAGKRYDAVLLDLALPGMDAPTALRQIRRYWPALPVAIVSGQSYPAVGLEVLAAGARAVVSRRMEPAELRALVESLVEPHPYRGAAVRANGTLPAHATAGRPLDELAVDAVVWTVGLLAALVAGTVPGRRWAWLTLVGVLLLGLSSRSIARWVHERWARR